MTAATGAPNPANVQGLIVRGYTHPCSTHMLFCFPSRSAAAAFVKLLLPRVQSGADWGPNKPAMMLNIGFTYAGLRVATALTDVKRFPATFRDGPASDSSQQSLSDQGDSDPALWWAKKIKPADLHCIVHAYALDDASMKTIVAFIADAATAAGVTELFGTKDDTRFEQARSLGDRIQFGYRDGISEPDLAWPPAGLPPDAPSDPGTLDNFIIGYPNAQPHPQSSPGPAGDSAAARFAKDGCYNAFRVIAQDVAGFEAFLDANAPAVVEKLGMTTADAREWIAAKVIGRWRNGSPLVLSPDAPDDATRDATVYGYAADTTGMKCPFSAHTRVSNPRDEDVRATDQPVPRLARRGMPYGPLPGVDPDADRGLIGLFLCGSFDTQFELIYGWMNTNNFSPLFSPGFNTQDAVVANRGLKGAAKTFAIPTPKGTISVTLPQFLTTRGTAYCLLPSMASLQAIAQPSS